MLQVMTNLAELAVREIESSQVAKARRKSIISSTHCSSSDLQVGLYICPHAGRACGGGGGINHAISARTSGVGAVAVLGG